MNNIPVVSFARRYWWVILVIFACVWLVFSPGAFRLLDLFVYLPAAFGISYGLPLLWRNIFHPSTTDDDVDSGYYKRGYKTLPERERVWIVTLQWIGYVIAASIITAGFLIFLSGIPPRLP
jgi:hypothetical protein